MNAAVAPAVRARDVLREAVDDVHARLHRLPVLARVADGSIDRASYRRLLVRLYGYHAPLDALFTARAVAFARHGIDVAAHRRLACLADDLAALGDDAAAAPSMPCTFDASSTARVFGLFYVREGATLGGRVLARALDPLFGDEARGRRFFAGDAGSGARWAATCRALERVAEDDGALADLVAGAHDGFTAFERWMT